MIISMMSIKIIHFNFMSYIIFLINLIKKYLLSIIFFISIVRVQDVKA